MRRKPHYHYCTTYLKNFWFFIGWRPLDTLKFLSKSFNVEGITFEGKGGYFISFLTADNRQAYVIWTRFKPTKPSHKATLAHEINHAVHGCLYDAGVHASFDNDEPEAYLTTEITRAAYEGL